MNSKKVSILFLQLMFIGALPFLYIWLHHIFVSGLNPILIWIFRILFWLSLFLFYWILIRWIKRIFPGKERLKPQILFFVGGICLILIWLISGQYSVMLHFSDTNYILTGFLTSAFIFLPFGLLGLLYLAFPKINMLPLSRMLVRIHFILSFFIVDFALAVNASFSRDPLEGTQHYTVEDGWITQAITQSPSVWINYMILVFILVQCLFLVNIFYSFYRKHNRQ